MPNRKRPRGRPKGRAGETWSAYVSAHTIQVIEEGARLRGMAAGKYLDMLVLALERLGPVVAPPGTAETDRNRGGIED